jgi:hypothetical protein
LFSLSLSLCPFALSVLSRCCAERKGGGVWKKKEKGGRGPDRMKGHERKKCIGYIEEEKKKKGNRELKVLSYTCKSRV